MVAGPNGSGKSTLVETLRKLVNLGVYVNADDIEKSLREHSSFDVTEYALKFTQPEFVKFFKNSEWNRSISADDLEIDGVVVVRRVRKINSYHAACLADFLRSRLLLERRSFTFETVMSHPDKVLLLKRAQSAGYRTYLYFVATDSPDINIARVGFRVGIGGHRVPKQKIVSRYFRSLNLLPDAIRYSNRAYVFDNSRLEPDLKLEATNAAFVKTYGREMPVWIREHVLIPMSAKPQ